MRERERKRDREGGREPDADRETHVGKNSSFHFSKSQILLPFIQRDPGRQTGRQAGSLVGLRNCRRDYVTSGSGIA